MSVSVRTTPSTFATPFGMTGARIVLTAAYELRERNLSLALCTLCISGGMGMAMVLERS